MVRRQLRAPQHSQGTGHRLEDGHCILHHYVRTVQKRPFLLNSVLEEAVQTISLLNLDF